MPTRTSSCNCGQLGVTYDGPDPKRISICQCYECQKRTGSVFSVQARLLKEHVTVNGESTTWTFPSDSGGATYHFCPRCGSTVYWDIAADPDVLGVAVGNFIDPTFPPPMISGFEAYGVDWAMNASRMSRRERGTKRPAAERTLARIHRFTGS